MYSKITVYYDFCVIKLLIILLKFYYFHEEISFFLAKYLRFFKIRK